MKVGRPKLYKVVEWSKREWILFRYNEKENSYQFLDKYKNESSATEEMERRYESRKLNQKFANTVKDFNIRKKNS